VNIPVSLEPAIRREALAAAIPVAGVCSLDYGVAVGVFQMTLQMVFTRERLVTSKFGTDEWPFFVVGPHVSLEATWAVEALRAGGADVVPVSAGLALCPQGATVGVVDLVVTVQGIVLPKALRSTSEKLVNGVHATVEGTLIPMRDFFCDPMAVSSVTLRFRAIAVRADQMAAHECGGPWTKFEIHCIFNAPRVRALEWTPDPCLGDRELSLTVASGIALQHHPYALYLRIFALPPIHTRIYISYSDHVRLRRRRLRRRGWRPVRARIQAMRFLSRAHQKLPQHKLTSTVRNQTLISMRRQRPIY
jgi:hypothetical protein